MTYNSRSALAAFMLGMAALVPGRTEAAFVTVGTDDGIPNVYPFGDPIPSNSPYKGEYQQVYGASAFSSPVTIDSIAFATVSPGYGPATDTFTVGLSTTSATLTSLSTDYAANEGADFEIVFTGTMTVTSAGSGAFDFSIPISPFYYNPALGDLLLDIVITSSSGSAVPFEATKDAVTSRAFNLNGSGPPTLGIDEGLLTEFGVTPASAVPEPCSLALSGIAGLVGLAYRGMRRRRPVA